MGESPHVENASVFRIKTLTIATTLLDKDEFTKNDLTQLYRALEQRTRSALDQVDDADGRTAMQDA